jgi:hypothetical protein
MPIIERCTHGAKNIATCKAVYSKHERTQTAHCTCGVQPSQEHANVASHSGRANRMKSDGTPDELRAIARYAQLRSVFALKGIPTSW